MADRNPVEDDDNDGEYPGVPREFGRLTKRVYRLADKQYAAALQVNTLETRMDGMEKQLVNLATQDQVRSLQQSTTQQIAHLETSQAQKLATLETTLHLKFQALTESLGLKLGALTEIVTPIRGTISKVGWAIVLAVLMALLALVLQGGRPVG